MKKKSSKIIRGKLQKRIVRRYCVLVNFAKNGNQTGILKFDQICEKEPSFQETQIQGKIQNWRFRVINEKCSQEAFGTS